MRVAKLAGVAGERPVPVIKRGGRCGPRARRGEGMQMERGWEYGVEGWEKRGMGSRAKEGNAGRRGGTGVGEEGRVRLGGEGSSAQLWEGG